MINVSSDVSLKRTIAETKNEKRHMTHRIDQLIFEIGNTKTLDDITNEEDDHPFLIEIDFVDLSYEPSANTFDS